MRTITVSSFILAATFILLLTPASARACCGHCWGDEVQPGNTAAGVGDAGAAVLSAAQGKKIASIRRTYGVKLDKLQSEVSGLDAAIAAELSRSNLDAARLKALHGKRLKAVNKARSLHEQMEAKIKKTLTRIQLKYYTSRVAGHWCRMGMHGWGGSRWGSHSHGKGHAGPHGWSCCGGDIWWK